MLERLFANQAYHDLKAALDLAAMRQVAIAQNIANADTPGYRRKIVSFDEELFAAIERQRLGSAQRPAGAGAALVAPRPKAALDMIRIVEDPNAIPNAAGNTVDLFQEMADQSENELRFETLSDLITMQLLALRKVIQQAGSAGQ
jgi:flagellar basal-body rod protein FlgB